MPYNGGIVILDERLGHALDRALAGARAKLEDDVRALSDEAVDELHGSFDATMAELASDIHALDSAQTLREVLDVLVDSARRHVDRVGLFLIKEGRLRPWRLKGIERREGLEVAQKTDARQALTFPLAVGGCVVAILYADNAHADVPSSRWSAAVDVLTRHASRVLESITLHQALGLVPPRPPSGWVTAS